MSYLFTSERLGFRNWRDVDKEPFFEISSDPVVMKYFPTVMSRIDVDCFITRMQVQYKELGFCYYAVDILNTGEFIGFIGISYRDYPSPFNPSVDIGWRLGRQAWGRGLATEGASCCLDYAHSHLDLSRVVAVCPVVNRRSEQVMKKAGMVHGGYFDHIKLLDHPQLKRCVWYESVSGSISAIKLL